MVSRYIFTNIFLCIMISFTARLSAQDSTNFFPHHLGDMWEYYFLDTVGDDTLQVTVISDSTDEEGNSYVSTRARRINPDEPPYVPWHENFFIDTLGQVFAVYPAGSLLLYKSKADLGEIWLVSDPLPWAIIDSVWSDTLFGNLTTFKRFNYYSWIDTTDTTFGFHLETRILADGFGLLYGGGGEAGYMAFLKGAVINGVVYGDTTLVSIDNPRTDVIPERVYLYQNYPNPFNSQTIIKFFLNKSVEVSLVIYALSGKEVIQLIRNQRFQAGEHEFMWNGKSQKGGEAASGVYFYQLTVEKQRLTRQMLLIR